MARPARTSTTRSPAIRPNIRFRAPLAKAEPSKRPTLLWIDDFEPGLALYRAMFELFGFRVLTASSGQVALDILERNYVDLVVTDYEMPDMNGEAVALAVKAISPEIPVLLFSGITTLPLRVRRTADGFCDKAGNRDALLAAVHNLLHKKRTPALQPPPQALPSEHGHRTVA